MLSEEIEQARRTVRTDAYQMSVGELITMYEDDELRIDPEFQRLFRWNISQKSRLIESLLLGIPLPSIFVFENMDGKWELIDGLQRMSTILEFMGRLRTPSGRRRPPTVLESTAYLPSLHNAVYERSENVVSVELDEQNQIDKSQQIAIRRARMGVEILKRPSDPQTKYDLFQRLNAGGSQANAQELRNCIMLMINPEFFRSVKYSAETPTFFTVTDVKKHQSDLQRNLELATRFLVHTFVGYDGRLDVEEYIDKGAVELAADLPAERASRRIDRTFALLREAEGKNALRRWERGKFVGKVGLVGLEGVAVGVSRNLREIMQLTDPVEFVKMGIRRFWDSPQAGRFTSPGLRGTTRIQRTVPAGEACFAP